ncbi:MAG: type II toxin-antitoxin system MqsA family antitoxin [Verrucomicrobiia bacterium]
MMKKAAKSDVCPLCGGQKKPGKVTFSADLGAGVVVVRNVRATICSQCGEEWIDNQTAKELESVVADARQKRMQVEVTTL